MLGLIDFGALNATSVGFDPIRYVYNEARKGYGFLEQELLEFSVVPVPANAEALQLAMKGLAPSAAACIAPGSRARPATGRSTTTTTSSSISTSYSDGRPRP